MHLYDPLVEYFEKEGWKDIAPISGIFAPFSPLAKAAGYLGFLGLMTMQVGEEIDKYVSIWIVLGALGALFMGSFIFLLKSAATPVAPSPAPVTSSPEKKGEKEKEKEKSAEEKKKD